jgi:NAD-dependent SIR2 family protein deacetylase
VSPEALAQFVRQNRRLLVLTGAGCSTASGIPAYRDDQGAWRTRPPVRYAEFVDSAAVRRRYWSRSLAGWPRVHRAEPAGVHHAIARLERHGHVHMVVTQNVDGLHQRAGSRRVIDLHGRLDEVECLQCGARLARPDVQQILQAWNPSYSCTPLDDAAEARPDGDAQVERDASDFRVPDCPACGGVLKPAVVFFGENVPRRRVEAALAALEACDALLVVGSSLMVFSGYRFCLAARQLGKPVAAVNLGRTRADDLLALKLVANCNDALPEVERAVLRSSSLD